ncbi:MAG: serine hydrolase [Candidatus Hydrogenedens sp.]|nr:serine hydrolase [Candidatus Hydrogenedentota bacterium]NLF57888.1 serine hydrolase [Candidatus Hydrogenedens sp.]
MKRWKRAAVIALAIILLLPALLLSGGLSWLVWGSRDLGAGYCAKILATGVFVLGRTPESMRENELYFVPRLGYELDAGAKTVTAWIFPSAKRAAVYREGLGVALSLDGDTRALQAQARPATEPAPDSLKDRPWPMGDAPSGLPMPDGYDGAALSAAVDAIFAEPNRLLTRNTRAVVVAYRDEIVAEKYAPGFGPEQRQAGWSMAKSVFHALFGIAVRDGKLNIADPVPVPAWRAPGDPRGGVTLDMLLRMRGGIDYSDFDFNGRPKLGELLFGNSGAAEYFMAQPLAHPPGTRFAYASGSTNLLSWVLRRAYGDDAYYALPQKELFGKLGMRSACFEADAAGTLIGSSYFFATPRDFVRFGLLYQNDGVWMGERILPEGWVAYGRTPSPGGPDHYGAHWWMPGTDDRARAAARGICIPEDAFMAAGYEGQKLLVIPSMKLVLLRLGLCYFSDFPHDELYNVLQAFPEGRMAAAPAG